jgi:hypothetical protein
MLRVFLGRAQETNHKQTKRRLAILFCPPCSFHWRGLSQPLVSGCENKPDGCAISIFRPLAEPLEQSRAAGLLENLLGERGRESERQKEKLDGILNKNDRLCFKLNKNKPFEEYIEVAYMLPLERFIFICLSMYKGGR